MTGESPLQHEHQAGHMVVMTYHAIRDVKSYRNDAVLSSNKPDQQSLTIFTLWYSKRFSYPHTHMHAFK